MWWVTTKWVNHATTHNTEKVYKYTQKYMYIVNDTKHTIYDYKGHKM